jgi:hypothetical protein
VTRARRYLAALSIGAAMLGVAACGSSDKKEGAALPRASVASISQRLDEVERRYESGTERNNAGACEDIENDSYKAIDATIQDLPDDVDPDVRKALEDSVARLKELTRDGCSNVKEEPRKEDTTPQETVPQQTVPQETAPEQTDTQETTPQETKPKKDKPKNENGNGNGNGNGNDVTPTQPGGTGTQPGSNGGGQPAPQADGQ